MNGNTGYLFYKKYYKLLPTAIDTSVNRDIEQQHLQPIPYQQLDYPVQDKQDCQCNNTSEENLFTTQPVQLVTTYPGLLIGTGYTHEARKNDEAYKIGFYFDFTTGMPVIPGHSVKGMLRSMFPNSFRKHLPEEYRIRRIQVINHLLNEVTENKSGDLSAKEITLLEQEIFDGKFNEKHLSLYCRDLFLDAVPVAIPNPNYQKDQKRLFGTDYITPHKHKEGKKELDPFSNPEPIKFLKVMPGVKYEFRFRLFNSRVCSALTAERKLELFRQILLLVGVGAKTNVGYGHFENNTHQHSTSGGTTEKPVEVHNTNIDKIKPGKTIIFGKVTNNKNGLLVFELMVDNYQKPASRKFAASSDFEIGEVVSLEVSAIQGKGEKRTIVIGMPKKLNK